jgi:hypothetical protein
LRRYFANVVELDANQPDIFPLAEKDGTLSELGGTWSLELAPTFDYNHVGDVAI